VAAQVPPPAAEAEVVRAAAVGARPADKGVAEAQASRFSA
jgi:hypothetical protein